jgi:oligopeptidase A
MALQNTNPLLEDLSLPRFQSITPEHVVPAVDALIAEVEIAVERIENTPEFTWDALMAPLDAIDRRVNQVWGPVGHLNAVKNSEALRTAYNQVLPKIVALTLRLAQSEKIYGKMKSLTNSEVWLELNASQRRAVELATRSAELAGIGLQGEKRERFNVLATRLSELETQFQNNVLDATKIFRMVLTNTSDVEGLPSSYLQMASQTHNRFHPDAQSTPENGPWTVTLDMPSYLPFMEHARNRTLREKLWRAHATRASHGEINNQPLILEILKLRKEQAELLGFSNWAERSLAEKMAENVPSVFSLLSEVRVPARTRAQRDLRDLETLAEQQGGTTPLEIWDTWYWRARLQEKELEFNDEILRPYFPLPQVLKGLFGLIENVFGVSLHEAPGTAELWHSDVLFFHVKDDSGDHIASLYFDPYSRPENKRGGAWMNICASRRLVKGEIEIPVAYICCNNRPPIGSTPSLLSFGEVTTLFHEMGHALQHMLTRVDIGQVSGISGIEWDAVELASQFMENWCYEENTLRAISRHHETGEQLPVSYIEKLRRFRIFASGLAVVRQLAFAEVDLVLHSSFNATGSVSPSEIYDAVAKKYLVVKVPSDDRFLCAFSHIFSGGYAAGYYSYLWAEVLSADAFAAFEEVGLKNEKEIQSTGRRYRETVLALGGSRHPQDVFREFRGRSPSTEALLRHRGLS